MAFHNGALVESRIKKEGSDDVAVVDEYSFSKQVGDRMVMDSFARYIYKADKAFGGMVYGENGYESYYSDSFPLIPAQGSELGGMEVESKRSTNILFSTRFFIKNKPFESNGKTYDFDQFVTRPSCSKVQGSHATSRRMHLHQVSLRLVTLRPGSA